MGVSNHILQAVDEELTRRVGLSRNDLEPFVGNSECYVLAENLALTYPQLLWDAGFYIRSSGEPADHAWVRTSDGTIIDTTHSQFDSSTPVLVAPPGTPEHARYVSWDQHHEPHCLFETIRPHGRCNVCGAVGLIASDGSSR
jgi:hypothetical protein